MWVLAWCCLLPCFNVTRILFTTSCLLCLRIEPQSNFREWKSLLGATIVLFILASNIMAGSCLCFFGSTTKEGGNFRIYGENIALTSSNASKASGQLLHLFRPTVFRNWILTKRYQIWRLICKRRLWRTNLDGFLPSSVTKTHFPSAYVCYSVKEFANIYLMNENHRRCRKYVDKRGNFGSDGMSMTHKSNDGSNSHWSWWYKFWETSMRVFCSRNL